MSSDSAAATDGDSAAEPGDTAEAEAEDGSQDDSERDLGEPGAPLSRRSPFVIGFFAGLGLFLAWTLGGVIVSLSSVLIEIVVALFLAAGLNPLVEWFERRGMRRSFAVLTVISGVILALALFLVAIVPVITDQVTAISQTAPDWLTSFQRNHWVRNLDRQYDVIDKVKSYVSDGKFVSGLFGGVLGIGLAVLSVVLNSFVVTVMTLYFLASLDRTKHALYGLAPASRRDRVTKLGDEIIKRVGGYVSGAFIVALCAGISSLVFLFVVGMGQYAVGARVRGRVARRDPDDRRDDRRRHRHRDRVRDRPEDRAHLHRLLRRLPAARELRDLPARDVEVRRRPRRRHRDRGPDRGLAARCGGGAAGDPHGRRDPDAHSRGLPAATGRALAPVARRGPTLTELDHDDPRQDQHSPGDLDGPRQLAEQDPGEDQGEEHLEQGDERREPRPQPSPAAMPVT